MRLAVDASVAVKWFLRTRSREQYLDEADAVARTIGLPGSELFTPDHWSAEVVAVLAHNDPSAIDDAILLLDDMRPRHIRGPKILKRASDMAIALDHHLFDTLYHVVALETGSTLVTADARYYSKAHSVGSIMMLHDFRAPA